MTVDDDAIGGLQISRAQMVAVVGEGEMPAGHGGIGEAHGARQARAHEEPRRARLHHEGKSAIGPLDDREPKGSPLRAVATVLWQRFCALWRSPAHGSRYHNDRLLVRSRVAIRSVGLVVALATTPARADDSGHAAAEQLFQDGRALFERAEYEAACEKFAESTRLDAAPGTLLNLAQCYEKLGRTASAWARYKQLQSVSSRRGQAERERYAAQKIDALEPTLRAIVIEVQNPAPDLTVTQDGITLGRTAWGSRIPVDPGAHQVAAHAPGHEPFTTTVVIGERDVRVVVPALGLRAKDAPTDARNESALRPIGIALLATGGAALATSLGFGLGAKLENDKAHRDECGARTCTREGSERIDRAIDYGNVSTVVGIGAVVLVAGGALLWVLTPRTRTRADIASPLSARF